LSSLTPRVVIVLDTCSIPIRESNLGILALFQSYGSGIKLMTDPGISGLGFRPLFAHKQTYKFKFSPKLLA